MNGIRIVFCTFPNIDSARQIGTALVEKQLAACVNLVTGIESVFRWQGKIESATEILAIFKTSADNYPAFEKALAELHPYDVPEIVAVEPANIAESYRSWVFSELPSIQEINTSARSDR